MAKEKKPKKDAEKSKGKHHHRVGKRLYEKSFKRADGTIRTMTRHKGTSRRIDSTEWSIMSRDLRLLSKSLRRVPPGRALDSHADQGLLWDLNTGLYLRRRQAKVPQVEV